MRHLRKLLVISLLASATPVAGVLTTGRTEAAPPPLPYRAADTRSGAPLAAGSTTPVAIAGQGPVPAGAAAVAVNLTVTQPTDSGYVTLYPCDAARPVASSVNYLAGQTIANSSIVRLPADGTICLYTNARTHLIVDVTSVFTNSGVSPVQPARLLETRPGGPTVDTRFASIGRVTAGSTTEVTVAGRGGVPGSARVVSLNVVASMPDAQGYLTMYACDASRPNTSSLNFLAGQTISNSTTSGLDPKGRVCIYSSASTDLILDVAAVYAGDIGTITAGRLMDTRPNASTTDGQGAGTGAVSAASTTVIPVRGRAGVPADAVAVAVNVAAVDPRGAGYLTVYPCDGDRPNASNLNYSAGATISNATITPLSSTGTICVYADASTDLLVDVAAEFPSGALVPIAAPPSQPSGNGPYIDTSRIPAARAGQSGIRLAPGPTPAYNPNDPVGAMRTDCRFSHMAFDDPIVYPGQSGRSHLHAFYGNSQAYASMTTTANGATSTCSGGQANNSAYWVPAMIDTSSGAPIMSDYLQIYYKTGYNGVTPPMVQPFPEGLRMIAGNASATSAQDINTVWFFCLSNGTKSSTIPDCATGDTMVMAIQFPQCWDGVNLDSPDHKSHMSVPLGWPNRGCPASHPVALTEITQHVWYPVPAGGTGSWRLSSDMYNGPAGYSSHADWWNGWNEGIMTGWVQRCMNRPLNCQMNLMGDGTQLVFPG